MSRLPRALAFVLRFFIVGLALAFLIALLWPQAGGALRTRFGFSSKTPPAQPIATSTQTTSQSGPVSYAKAVAQAAPAVVNIYANKVVTERQVRVYPDPLLQRLFGSGVAYGPAYNRLEQSLGSGVIFSTDGYVLTNNHVISGADDIQVRLYDGRLAHAKVVGTDTDTDLAVLKIDADNLPSIAIADKHPLRVGDVVLAIGNPFGLTQTVTLGIVSANGRQLNLSPYEDFIQTDAAINSGNSGGALVNAYGQLVGINTAMLGRNAGAEGIGFAIPVSTAKMVLDQIVDHGKVIRGWLGAEYGPVSVRANSGLPAAARGVVVRDIYPGSPAARAGLQVGDVLLSIDGRAIADAAALRSEEATLKPGTKVEISGLRSGAPFTTAVVLSERPELSELGQS